ncbi:MAG: hypothetical protein AAFV46_02655 [Cyanobacteria bacterium J06635_11]
MSTASQNMDEQKAESVLSSAAAPSYTDDQAAVENQMAADNQAGQSRAGQSARKRSGSRSNIYTGVAAVASVGVVLPLAGEGAVIAAPDSTAPQAVASQSTSQSQAAADAATGEGVAPQVAQQNQALFSTGGGAQQVPNQQGASSATASGGQAPLISKGADGNWSLSYQAQQAQRTQSVVTQLANDIRQPADAQSVCSGAGCQGVKYIEAQLPEARRRVQALEQELKEFEAANGQTNMSAYQKTLNNRISEIAQQRAQLTTAMDDNRQLISQLKMRLVTVNADLDFAEQVIAQDMAYQTVWERLKQSEQALLKEFTKVDIDSTALNATYADYQYHQQWLQRTVQEALSNYLLAPGTTPPDFIYRAPAALNVMQDLVIATHEYKVQQLRDQTIQTIEARLQDRKSQLVGNYGEYERLQRELASARQVVLEYESGRDRISTEQTTASATAEAALDARVPVLTRAQNLSLELPSGSVGKTLLGIVVAAGAVGSAVAYRKYSKATEKPSRPVVLTIEPSVMEPRAIKPATAVKALSGQSLADTHALPAASHGVRALSGQAMDALTLADPREPRPAAVQQLTMQQALRAPDFNDLNELEENMLNELLEVTGQPPLSRTLSLAAAGQTSGQASDQAISAVELLEDADLTADASLVTSNLDAAIAEVDDFFIVDEDASIESMVMELDTVINQNPVIDAAEFVPPVLEESFAEKFEARAAHFYTDETFDLSPVRLSLEEIDRFAEHAIRWVLADLASQKPVTAVASASSEQQVAQQIEPLTNQPVNSPVNQPEMQPEKQVVAPRMEESVARPMARPMEPAVERAAERAAAPAMASASSNADESSTSPRLRPVPELASASSASLLKPVPMATTLPSRVFSPRRNKAQGNVAQSEQDIAMHVAAS